MSTDPRSARPWWKRPLPFAIMALVALRAAGISLFRHRNRTFLRAVRTINRRALNPAMLRLAGRPHWYAARLEHVGRRSGRGYATPVVALPVRDGFAIPLVYGTDVDWRRNLDAAGGGVLQVAGMRHTVRTPRMVTLAQITTELPAYWRLLARLYRLQDWLLLTAEN